MITGCIFKINRSVEVAVKYRKYTANLHKMLKPLRIPPPKAYLFRLRCLLYV